MAEIKPGDITKVGESAATYAELNIANNPKGEAELLGDLKKILVEDLKAIVEDTARVKKTVRNVWVGDDADAFIAEFDKRVKEIVNDNNGNLKTSFANLKTTLKGITEQWDNLREENKTKIFD